MNQTTENLKLTRHEFWGILFVLAVALGNLFNIDMYLPSMPAIQTSLQISQASVQHTISFYILALAFSGLIFGSLSDKTGRKSMTLFGLFITIIGTVICFKAMSGHILLFGRIMQGIGAGASIGSVRAMVSDFMSGKKLAIFGAYFSSLMALSPVVAPVVGGYIQHYFNWRANFIVLGIYTLAVFIWALFIAESNQNKHLHSFNYKYHLKNYAHLLVQSNFMTYTFCGGFAIAASMAYATSGPFILQKTLHLTPVLFGWMGIFVGLGNILAKLSSPTLIKKFDMQKVLCAGLICILLSGIILLFNYLFFPITLVIVMFVVMLSLFGQGLSSANAVALGVSPYRHIGGAANALWTFMQMSLSFLVSFYLSLPTFKFDQVKGLSSAYILIGALTLTVYLLNRYLISTTNNHSTLVE